MAKSNGAFWLPSPRFSDLASFSESLQDAVLHSPSPAGSSTPRVSTQASSPSSFLAHSSPKVTSQDAEKWHLAHAEPPLGHQAESKRQPQAPQVSDFPSAHFPQTCSSPSAQHPFQKPGCLGGRATVPCRCKQRDTNPLPSLMLPGQIPPEPAKFASPFRINTSL